jgi:hypothetical protein
MSLMYHIYSNDGMGGPVDFAAPIGTTAALTFTPPDPAHPSDTTWAVRAFDDATGYEYPDVAARCRLILDASGNDATARPNAPIGLTVRPGAAGTLIVAWHYSPAGQLGAPTSFRVYAGSPAVSYGSPAMLVPATTGIVSSLNEPRGFAATLTGLTAGATYQVAVRAVNATGEEPNTSVATATVAVSGPSAPISVSASVVP